MVLVDDVLNMNSTSVMFYLATVTAFESNTSSENDAMCFSWFQLLQHVDLLYCHKDSHGWVLCSLRESTVNSQLSPSLGGLWATPGRPAGPCWCPLGRASRAALSVDLASPPASFGMSKETGHTWFFFFFGMIVWYDYGRNNKDG